MCKDFLDAVEKKQYGWFWRCLNGGKECHYRHVYVLKSQMKALLEEEGEKLTVEEEIENRVRFGSTSQLWFTDYYLFNYPFLPVRIRNWNNPVLFLLVCKGT